VTGDFDNEYIIPGSVSSKYGPDRPVFRPLFWSFWCFV